MPEGGRDLAHYRPSQSFHNFDAISIRLASPEVIKSWAKSPNPNAFVSGEVKKPETINYRTFRPEKDGLFCEAIFGPTKDWECACGKYKRIKYKGVVCDRCGVEVAQAKVRRERMGYILLATPVSHIWFFKGVPSRLGLLLDLSLKELERVLYFEAYIVLDPGDSPIEYKDRLTEDQYQRLREHGYHFRAEMGAAAIKEILRAMDLEREGVLLEAELAETNSKQKAKKIRKRLKLLRGLQKSGNRPEWMILDVIPVMPPELRPLVALDGGRFATSDLNDLYRRVINRNNRLQKLVGLKAPEVIIRNEKRMLQEAVDALIENGKHGRVVKGPGNRPLKSLSDMLKGKPGRFRQNLLGKRVDYSGRSVIVVGPELRLNQCGIPKKMALELFKPFIIRKLQEKGHATTIRSAKRMAERVEDEVWEVLEEVIQEHPVLLNRAPTLHRLGIQAFQPQLVEGEAIRIPPLICQAFNADFDGDQMAVHVPLSAEAQVEAQLLMSSMRNVLKPAHGDPVAVPVLDMVLGCHYLTKELPAAAVAEGVQTGQVILARNGGPNGGQPPVFANREDALYAYEAGIVGLHEWVDVRLQHGRTTAIVRTTPGRLIFSQVLPEDLVYDVEDRNGNVVRLPFLNREVITGEIRELIAQCFQSLGNRRAAELLNDLKDLGFRYATVSGLSLAVSDFAVPRDKAALRRAAEERVEAIEQAYREGALSAGERYNRIIAVWGQLTEAVQKSLFDTLERSTAEQRQPALPEQAGEETGEDASTSELPAVPLAAEAPSGEMYAAGFNPVYVMADSGARAQKAPMRQIAGMRGLMAKPDGSIIETPIFASFREGLTVLEYFISTHGARKGLADTAIKTAQSGYLTRKLVDVSQDVIITDPDCGTLNGVTKTAMEAEEDGELLSERVAGRVALEDVVDAGTGRMIVPAGEVITADDAREIDEAGVLALTIRSPLTCEATLGVCQKCYGTDLSNHRVVDIGEAIGILAAQSIGEPGTQLTMRTFHTGGVVSGTTGTVSEIRARSRSGIVQWKSLQTTTRPGGDTIALRNGVLVVTDTAGREREQHRVFAGAVLHVREGEAVARGDLLFRSDPTHVPILSRVAGTARLCDVVGGLTLEELVDEATGQRERVITDYRREDIHPRVEIVGEDGETVIESYVLPTGARLSVADGDSVFAGHTLARIPRGTAKSSDIVSGLPRVTELFEARKPKERATITEVSGAVSFPGMSRGMQIVRVTSDTDPPVSKDYKIPLGKFIIVQEGDVVEAGDCLTDGPLDPHDILAVKGKAEVQRYLVREIKDVYRSQGERINDKHIEVIIRQMMKKVRITDPGDTDFLEGDEVSLNTFRRENARAQHRSVQEAVEVLIADVHPSAFVQVVEAERLEGYLGRTLAEAIVDPGTGETLAEAGASLDAQAAAAAREAGIETVKISGLSVSTEHLGARLAEAVTADDGGVLAHEGDALTEELLAVLAEKGVPSVSVLAARVARPAQSEPILQGVTKASLSTESFISAASFQQTTNVLTGAAVIGKRDPLRGVKENVIMGRLIPAGTGMPQHRRIRVEARRPVAATRPALEATADDD
jgi:DNA-directed RNA polymerase subunit beta'